MVFTRVVPALLFAAAVSVPWQAFYDSDALFTREFEEEFSERGLDHLNVVRELATNNEVLVLTARDFEALGLRSEDILSEILVARRTPSPGPYVCTNKADCQKHIVAADHEIGLAKAKVDEWKNKLKAAKKGSKEYETAKNNLHTATESRAGWQENKEDYERIQAGLPA